MFNMTIAQLTAQPSYVGQPKANVDTPALLIDLAAMERNIKKMARTFHDAGVGWRPHTKGLKVPQIAQKLLDAGAFGVTCAKVGEAEVMANAGITDILIANQVVGEQKIARLLALLPDADPIVAVDDENNVLMLDRAAGEKGLRLRVVVEVNTGMDRAGVPPSDVVALSSFIAARPNLRYAGLMGWEGQAVKIADQTEKRAAINSAVKALTDAADRCRQAGLTVDIVSCGGTGTYAITALLPGVTEVQAGGGILCDVCYSEDMHVTGHEFAATILTTVTSRPTPTRIITDAGKKAMSSDGAIPRPLLDEKVKSVSLSAEHARVELQEPNTSLRVGDKLEFVVGYTDTTTMLHDELYGIRDGRVEVVWPVLGRGKFR
jgi:D-serine deaminase-like pyridoxal phosphate-dependent protein